MELMTEKFLTEQQESDSEFIAPELPTDLDEHPWVYVHERCGHATEMPAGVRRNYLSDPCYYLNFMGTVCANCGGPVPDSQLFWTETGECLADYMRRLKKDKSETYHLFRYGCPLLVGATLAGASTINLVKNGQPFNLFGFILAVLFFAAIAWLPCRFLRLFLCRLKLL